MTIRIITTRGAAATALFAGLALGGLSGDAMARPSGRPTPAAQKAAPAPEAAPAAPQPAPVAAPAAAAPAAAPAAVAEAPPPPWPEPIWLLEAPSFERRGGGGRRGGDEHAEHGAGGAPAEGRRRGGERPAETAGAPGVAANATEGEANAGVDATESMGMSFGRGAGPKTLVLKRGSDPLTAVAAGLGGGPASLNILAADGKRSATPFVSMGKAGARAKVELEDYGFYNASLVQKSAHNGVLDVQIAGAELLKGAMAHGGHSEHDPALFKPTMDDAAPFEIIREHSPREMLMTMLYSGEKSTFLVRSHGKPVAGATVSLATQQGWRKTVTTGPDGRASFTLVRDYFPDWSDFNRRQAGVFLVWAQMETPEAGVLDGQSYASTRYQASMTARYYPAPFDYKSYGYGVGLVVFMTAFASFAVWFYRQRRSKPYKEVVFDERIA